VADDCLFCRIVRKEIPATIVAEDANCIAFRDINAKAPTHVLVIPRAHYASLNDVTDPAVIAQMFDLGAKVAKAEGIAESGFRAVINTNADGGQTVFHVHLHVLGGRRLKWPPG
jgi:histidine triad (HIT) family protein